MAGDGNTYHRAPSGGPAGRIVEVLVPLALDHAYSYACPAGLDLQAGDVVQVPLGARSSIGVVWDSSGSAPPKGPLKSVSERIKAPALSLELRQFIDWVARYTLAPKGMVLRMALHRSDPDKPERVRLGVRLAGPPPARLTPARSRVLEIAASGLAYSKAALAEEAGVSTAVIDGLVDEGTLATLIMAADSIAADPDPAFGPPVLSPEQGQAADQLKQAVAAKAFSVALLEGVTGSGKTEVYFEAVAEAIKQGRQTLILVPEIALTAQFLDRFAARFGIRPAQWHSGITGRKREHIYAALASGEAKVVAGARSALFLPFADLGLVIVDEEHEGAYKQEDGVHYHARDMAVLRGRIEGAAVVLASATPSIESRVNADQGKYKHVLLPDRFGGKAMPHITPIDLRVHAPKSGQWLSAPLIAAIHETLARGEQALLYLNRRGYAPVTLCRTCGHKIQCPNCTAWLVEHRYRRALMCHHCGHLERKPEACPSCGTVDSLTACGPGVERLAEEVATLFPDHRRMTLSSDMPGGTERLRQELEAITKGDCDIVIGTQLVAKGHHFPKLALVGVIDGDLGLATGDPRAGERSFQVLQQVTGRAGRAETEGRAFIQTYQPEHPVMQALIAGDSEGFYREEIRLRQAAHLPPFGRMAALIVSATDRPQAETMARALARVANPPPEVVVLGPAEAPIAVVRGRHRFRLLVKTSRGFDMQAWLRAWLERAPKPTGSVRIGIDVDPYSFY